MPFVKKSGRNDSIPAIWMCCVTPAAFGGLDDILHPFPLGEEGLLGGYGFGVEVNVNGSRALKRLPQRRGILDIALDDRHVVPKQRTGLGEISRDNLEAHAAAVEQADHAGREVASAADDGELFGHVVGPKSDSLI